MPLHYEVHFTQFLAKVLIILCHSTILRGSHLLPSQLPGEHTGLSSHSGTIPYTYLSLRTTLIHTIMLGRQKYHDWASSDSPHMFFYCTNHIGMIVHTPAFYWVWYHSGKVVAHTLPKCVTGLSGSSRIQTLNFWSKSWYSYPLDLFIHIDTHTCLTTDSNTYINTYIHEYIHTHIHMCIYVYIHKYIHAHRHSGMACYIHTCISAYIQTIYIHTRYKYACSHIYIYIYIYIWRFMHA